MQDAVPDYPSGPTGLMLSALTSVSNGRIGRELVWSWLKSKWEIIGKKMDLTYRAILIRVRCSQFQIIFYHYLSMMILVP